MLGRTNTLAYGLTHTHLTMLERLAEDKHCCFWTCPQTLDYSVNAYQGLTL
jgi:hypothetical protein